MPGSNGNNARLDSWKDIATYLRRDVRTVIRWEKQKGLPVRRVPGGQRKSVFAYTTELDNWLTREGEKPQSPDSVLKAESEGMAEAALLPNSVIEPQSGNWRSRIAKRSYYIALVAAAVWIVGWLAVFGPRLLTAQPDMPTRVAFTPTSLQAFNERGQVLWTHRFEEPVDDQWQDEGRHLVNLARIADFRGNGKEEILAAIPVKADINFPDQNRWQVDLFSSKGQLLWSYVPQRHFQFGKYEIGEPWSVMDVLASEQGRKAQIWVAVCQGVWGNSYVVNLDPESGQETLRFVNTGSIHSLAELKTLRGNYLLVGGFNNEPDTGSLAVVDEAKGFAASPQSEGSRHKCTSCPKGDPDYYFVFPRSEINELEHIHEASVIQVQVLDDQIQVRKSELRLKEDDPQTIYILKVDDGLQVASLRFGSGYDMLHRRLEKEGKLDHTLENCPERLHPRAVKIWTPAEGWSEIKLEPTTANQ